MAREFNVLIENHGKFEPYNIMVYLERCWKRFKKEWKKYYESSNKDNWWKFPETYKEIKDWVEREIKYNYWARCEYEMLLIPWPPRTNEEGNITENGYKIDIYEQCKMNLDIITKIFIEDIVLNNFK